MIGAIFRRTRFGRNGQDSAAPAQSVVGRATARVIGPEGGDQLKSGVEEGLKRRLGRDPVFRALKRLELRAAVATLTRDRAAIDQVQQHRDAAGQRGVRPVRRDAQIVLQPESDEAQGIGHKRLAVLVIAMLTIMGQEAGPVT